MKLSLWNLLPFLFQLYKFIKSAVDIVEVIDNIISVGKTHKESNEWIRKEIESFLISRDILVDEKVNTALEWYKIESIRTYNGKSETKKNIAFILIDKLVEKVDKIRNFTTENKALYESMIDMLIELRVYFLNRKYIKTEVIPNVDGTITEETVKVQ